VPGYGARVFVSWSELTLIEAPSALPTR
jgi:hypothetical protein